jgi:hypothetical protein
MALLTAAHSPSRRRVPVPSNWIRGFIQLTGLVRGWALGAGGGGPLIPIPSGPSGLYVVYSAVDYTDSRRLQLASVPGEFMLRPYLSVGCLGLLRLETSDAMRVVSYYTGAMSCFNTRQPSEVVVCAVPWLSDPICFGSPGTWPNKVPRTSLSSRPLS